MITLKADAKYGYGGKQFIARILGRDSKFTFNREFIGRKGGKRNESRSADVDEAGLYEERDINSKGRVSDSYPLLLELGEELSIRRVDKEDAMKIASLLDSGKSIDQIVEAIPGEDKKAWRFVADRKELKPTADQATISPEQAKNALEALFGM